MNGDDDTSWTPPSSPDPSVILHEAVDDAQNGHYALALKKHRWYFDHALEHEPAQYGVRLSFALGYWHELATVYPPAMGELYTLRDRATQNAIAGIDIHESFHDAKSLNRVLGDTTATRDLFMQLHKIDRDYAKTAYHIAQPVLITCGEYDVCNEYLDADSALDRIIELFHFRRDESVPDFASNHRRQFAEDNFGNESATVIALLVSADRLNDAQKLAQRVIAEWNDESVRDIINRALHGEFPPQRE